MNGDGGRDGSMKMEEIRKMLVFMWGYLPGALPKRSPLLVAGLVKLGAGCSWKDVCGGGCGFAMAISDSGKLITWGSTDDLGQSYVTSGKHGETPEPFPLPTEATVVKAAAGWAHCISVTESGEVHMWEWKECVPSGKSKRALALRDRDLVVEQCLVWMVEEVERRLQSIGVRIATVAAGWRHTLALSDVGSAALSCGSLSSEEQGFRVPGNYVMGIACGGRHSAVITDAGALPTFGWGLYGQCGHGTETLPRLLDAPSLENIHAKIVFCGACHSALITENGKVFCWGWNKYGQHGLGDVIDRNIPSQVAIDGCISKNVACGWWHTLLLAESPT
ncbi:hypothetical protein F0562_026376 [Nyssa sinensis]|uniref:Ultraviolet-B receptor UVR8 n=1 Tax=Nyssa sinensis TaxID=561372 RepID=A0A5J5BAK5_9ASTE|nr:hypothetical protein F0562_026376 [Nyssa sinensis]